MSTTELPEKSEFRLDVISGGWVVFAPERARRPMELSHVKPHERENVQRASCPFCPGMEHETPDPVFLYPAEGPWQIRVCPNKFPAVRPIAPDTHGLTQRLSANLLPGFGVHEIVIEGAAHEADPTMLSDELYQQVLIAYRERIKFFATDRRMDYVSVFKNVGAEAGASMAHLHSQMIVTPFVPNLVRGEMKGAEAYFGMTHRCVFCDMLQRYSDGIQRLVAESPRFIVVCPFAPRFAYEMWILPREHSSHFDTITDDEAFELAQLLKKVIRALDQTAGMPAFNYFLHTSPLRTAPSKTYHWHLEIVPRTARAAGYEWSTGVFINTVMPERAALELQAAAKEF
jgi:UDPglucose--hexose-1-phosphate uridylyltransferase